MPIEVTWEDDKKTIIRQRFTGVWVKDEFVASTSENFEMIESVGHPVDVIMDLTENETNPLQALNIFTTAQSLDKVTSLHQRAVVIVGANLAVELALKAARRIARKAAANAYVAKTVEEAHEIITKQVRAS